VEEVILVQALERVVNAARQMKFMDFTMGI
jgi:hypothetical protein